MENKNTLAVIGFFCSIVNFLCCLGLLAIPALVCCIVAYNNRKYYSEQNSYAGLAKAGIGVSAINIVILVMATIIQSLSGFIGVIVAMCD